MNEPTRLSIDFAPTFVTIEGSAPRELAFEISMALAPIFKRHGMGLHLSVKATPEGEKITRLPRPPRARARVLRKVP